MLVRVPAVYPDSVILLFFAGLLERRMNNLWGIRPRGRSESRRPRHSIACRLASYWAGQCDGVGHYWNPRANRWRFRPLKLQVAESIW